MKKTIKKLNKKRGFIILFSMLISSIILLISSGIYNVVQKQVVLSSYARESQKAFYAADAALDCALFHDVSPTINRTAFPVDETAADTSIKCGGWNTDVIYLDAGNTNNGEFNFSYVFRYSNSQVSSGCAYVLIEKEGVIGNRMETRITASGFNTCMEVDGSGTFDTPDFDDPTLLERRLSIRYTTTVSVEG